MRNYFADLGVTPSTPLDGLRLAWINKRKRLHGDRTGNWDSEEERIVNVAYSVLKDPAQHKLHISTLKFTQNVCPTCHGSGAVSTTVSWTVTRLDTCPTCNGAGYFPR